MFFFCSIPTIIQQFYHNMKFVRCQCYKLHYLLPVFIINYDTYDIVAKTMMACHDAVVASAAADCGVIVAVTVKTFPMMTFDREAVHKQLHVDPVVVDSNVDPYRVAIDK